MSAAEELADILARDVIVAMDDTGDDTLVEHVSRILLATSSTMQEAFTTSIKVRPAERRARKFLDEKLAGSLLAPEKEG
ncbi:MAG: hypothetical protein U1D35_13370 [Paracoccaceae bacterium]|nr:hypothetical protein [Paracoccaceae bacterium]